MQNRTRSFLLNFDQHLTNPVLQVDPLVAEHILIFSKTEDACLVGLCYKLILNLLKNLLSRNVHIFKHTWHLDVSHELSCQKLIRWHWVLCVNKTGATLVDNSLDQVELSNYTVVFVDVTLNFLDLIELFLQVIFLWSDSKKFKFEVLDLVLIVFDYSFWKSLFQITEIEKKVENFAEIIADLIETLNLREKCCEQASFVPTSFFKIGHYDLLI